VKLGPTLLLLLQDFWMGLNAAQDCSMIYWWWLVEEFLLELKRDLLLLGCTHWDGLNRATGPMSILMIRGLQVREVGI